MIAGQLEEKNKKLRAYIKECKSLAIAFSGGVDSTFLLKVAHEELGDNAVAITAKSISFPEREHKESEEFCAQNGIKQIVVEVDQMEIPGFKNNPPDRCYLCKKQIFQRIISAANELSITNIAEGSNDDDNDDYRPGIRAIKELGVLSPLQYAELTKSEIRELSKELGLPTWSKPSFACLATRFVYGQEITPDKISMVGKAEEVLFSNGFSQARCRIHGDLARIEVPSAEIDRLLDKSLRETIYTKINECGFSYVSLDLLGYRTGSMNETLDL